MISEFWYWSALPHFLEIWEWKVLRGMNPVHFPQLSGSILLYWLELSNINFAFTNFEPIVCIMFSYFLFQYMNCVKFNDTLFSEFTLVNVWGATIPNSVWILWVHVMIYKKLLSRYFVSFPDLNTPNLKTCWIIKFYDDEEKWWWWILFWLT